MKYCVRWRPIPLSRPRFGHGRVYDAQKEDRIYYTISLEQQHGNLPMLSGALELDVTFFMPIPAGMSNKKKMLIEGTPHYIKPDASNLLKWLEDCAQNIIYKDDALISSVIARKIYDREPRTEFTVKPYKDNNGQKEPKNS